MNPRVALTISVLVFCFSLFVLFYFKISTGEFIKKGIDFKGGKVIELETSGDVSKLKQEIESNFKDASVTTSTFGFKGKLVVQLPFEEDEEKLYPLFDKNSTSVVSRYVVSPEIAKGFLTQASFGILLAFFLMSFVVFLLFREIVPSFAVIIAAACDILETMAMMNILGIPLSSVTLVALMMVLGYSVDTDILLTTRLLKKRDEGDLEGKIKGAAKTGIMMSLTSLTALLSMIVVAGYSSIFGQLASVLAIALLFDLINTWLQNASILKLWLSKVKNK